MSGYPSGPFNDNPPPPPKGRDRPLTLLGKQLLLLAAAGLGLWGLHTLGTRLGRGSGPGAGPAGVEHHERAHGHVTAPGARRSAPASRPGGGHNPAHPAVETDKHRTHGGGGSRHAGVAPAGRGPRLPSWPGRARPGSTPC